MSTYRYAVAFLLLGSLPFFVGCQPEQNKVAEGIANAEAQAKKDMAAAKADFDQVSAEVQKSVQQAQANLAKANSNGTPAPADAVQDSGDGHKKLVEAQYALDVVNFDTALLVAKARCEAMADDARKSCIEAAQAKHDADLAAAKTRAAVAK